MNNICFRFLSVRLKNVVEEAQVQGVALVGYVLQNSIIPDAR